MPYMLCTPRACTAHIHCPHRPLLCLPGCHARSQPAQSTYKHHMHTHMRVSLAIDASPCQVLYAPLSPTSCTHVCASLTHTPLCPYRLLLCPPHSIGLCTLIMHIVTSCLYLSMPRHAIHLRTPKPTLCTHSCLPHSPTPIYTNTGPLTCLPHSITAHTHDHAYTHAIASTYRCLYLLMPSHAMHFTYP